MEQLILGLMTVLPYVSELAKRLILGIAAQMYGRGGVSRVSALTGASRTTVRKGMLDCQDLSRLPQDGRIRAKGAGRPSATTVYPELMERIKGIVEENTYGDPQKVVHYTSLSRRSIQKILKEKYNILVCANTIGRILDELGYSRQANKKMLQEGKPHPDRDDQFKFIKSEIDEFEKSGDAIISIDTKKKEPVGNFKNAGTEYRKKKDPRPVLNHDFPELRAVPYGIYDVKKNKGFVVLGKSHDTPRFAVNSIRIWWNESGKADYPNAKRLLILADSGGSNSCNSRVWKKEIFELGKELGISIHVSHYPTGCSKWNPIEHKLFCFITKNWQGKPLTDLLTIQKYIQATSTETGLSVQCVIDYADYPLKEKVDDKEFNSLPIQRLQLGKWNYAFNVASPAETVISAANQALPCAVQMAEPPAETVISAADQALLCAVQMAEMPPEPLLLSKKLAFSCAAWIPDFSDLERLSNFPVKMAFG